jgi:formylglycine-generating enzyme required for sulfatase activity
LAGLRDGIAADLRALAFSSPPIHPDPAQRNRAATLLDRLGADDRPELDPACAAYWAESIAPGAFRMGDDNGYYDDEKPAFDYTIRRRYALARFPVTNRQYLRFLEDLEAQGRDEEANARRPRTWPGQRFRAGEGNHPVTGVGWEDATAFAAWAHERYLTPEQRAAGAAIRLPTEPEWERAAAYPRELPGGATDAGRREYPWGPWPDLTATASGSITTGIPANIDETGLGGTSAVGIFPHGAAACGAQDMAGNVWERCATPCLPYTELARTDDLAPITLYDLWVFDQTYALRGGSYHDARYTARCASRGGDNPLGWIKDVGLRLARLFSLT